MNKNTAAYKMLTRIIDNSECGLYIVVASRDMQREIGEHYLYSHVCIIDCNKDRSDEYSFSFLKDKIAERPDCVTFFILDFQRYFIEPNKRQENLIRLNFSRDVISRLGKNIVFFTTAEGDRLICKYALDLYSYVKLKMEFEDELPEETAEPVSYHSGLEVTTRLDIVFEQARNKLLSDAISYMNQAEEMIRKAKYPEAMNLLAAALKIREKVLGEDHPDTAETYDRIGYVYRLLGDYKKSLDYNEKALRIRERTLGKENAITADSYNNIGNVYSDMGEYGKALEWYEKAKAVCEKVLGSGHPDTATTYNNIANVYDNMGEYRKALEWYEKALAVREKVLGSGHPETAGTYNNIALVYSNMGEYGKALEWYKKALAVSEKILGSDHPDTAGTYNNIAVVYDSMGEYGKALEWHEKALAVKEKVLGSDHPDTAMTYNNIANVYVQMGEYGKALEWYEKALAIYVKMLGEDHPRTKLARQNMDITKRRLEEEKKKNRFKFWKKKQ